MKTACKVGAVWSLGLAAVLASTVTAEPAIAADARARIVPVVTSTAQLPSCRSIEYPGDGGKISVQTAPNGTVAWGITMYNQADVAGRWDIDTLVNARKTTSSFHRALTGPYIPHGSVPPAEATRGGHFSVAGTLVSANGKTFQTAPNDCIIL